jgi:hypothetical protein
MEEGYILDYGDGDSRTVNTWVEGEPVKSFWMGLKIKDKEQYKVKTFRCAGCGYLESYALEAKEQGSIFS